MCDRVDNETGSGISKCRYTIQWKGGSVYRPTYTCLSIELISAENSLIVADCDVCNWITTYENALQTDGWTDVYGYIGTYQLVLPSCPSCRRTISPRENSAESTSIYTWLIGGTISAVYGTGRDPSAPRSPLRLVGAFRQSCLALTYVRIPRVFIHGLLNRLRAALNIAKYALELCNTVWMHDVVMAIHIGLSFGPSAIWPMTFLWVASLTRSRD